MTCFSDTGFFSLPRVAFHLVPILQWGKGPSFCQCFYLYLALFTLVYSHRNVFSSSLHLFTFMYLSLFATFALCKIKRYKQPRMQIIRSKSNIIRVSLMAWTLIRYAKRGSLTQGWCLTLGAVECCVLDDSKSVALKWRAHQNQVRVAALYIFRAYSHFILNSDVMFTSRDKIKVGPTCFLSGLMCG